MSSSKLDIPNRHNLQELDKAWMFQMRIGKRTHTKNFNYKKLGGKDKALKVAIAFRDKFVAENKIDLKSRFMKSDIVGVNQTFDTRPSGDKVYYWQAIWTENGQQKTKRFSERRYGADKAKELAIRARDNAMQSLVTGVSSLFTSPDDKNIKLWRYMDFTKFVYMLEHKALFFPLVDKLGDPYEGELSRGNKKWRSFVYSRAKKKRNFEALENEISERRKSIYINCWHMNKIESAAMWKLYSKSNEAICVQTTFHSFVYALHDFIKVGQVKYIDYENEWIPEDDVYYPFIYKRNSFSHEHELRALIDLTKKDEIDLSKIEITKTGIWVPVNLYKLVHNIYLAPDSPDWFKTLVEKVIVTYGLTKKKVTKSPLMYKHK